MARSTRADWERRVRRWRRSGLKRDEFAALEGVKPTTLGWWAWALQRNASTALVKRDAFVQVTAVEVPTTIVLERIEILLENGRVVRVPAVFDDAHLGRVLDVAGRR